MFKSNILKSVGLNDRLPKVPKEKKQNRIEPTIRNRTAYKEPKDDFKDLFNPF